MRVRFYGVRGSIPVPGKHTLKYGGNTTCFLVEVDGYPIIIDAGSGIRQLGAELMREDFGKGAGEASLFFTHMHWDHIHGWPYFTPAYIHGNQFKIFGPSSLNVSLEDSLVNQQQYQNFPIMLSEMPARFEFFSMEENRPVHIHGAEITARRLNHPGGVMAYRIEHNGKAVVFATDVEHYSVPDYRLLKLAKDADLMVYDAHFTPDEYVTHIGWGHSTYEEAIKLAKKANIKSLRLTHHAPEHSDAFVDEYIVKPARELFDDVDGAKEEEEIIL